MKLAPQGPCPSSGALPARAIRSRLQAASETPSWAVYLPCSPRLGDGQVTGVVPWQQAPQPGASDSAGSVTSGAPTSQRKGIFLAEALAEPCQKGCQVDSGNGCGGRQVSATDTSEENTVQDVDVAGHVWSLSREAQGCRQVQQALERAISDEDRQSLASELAGHVWEALRCPHANFVIQKCISTLRPQAAQFIIDEIMRGNASGDRSSGASQAARHRYGCRILERLLEHCPPGQVERLVEEIINDSVSLAKHPYGNYVIQHLLEHGQPDQRRRVTKLLQVNAHSAGSDCYARAVISKALSFGQREDQVALARALLREPGLICTMARTRHGHVAAKFILQNLEVGDREEACRQLSQDAQVLRASRYGRFVAACLEGNEPAGGIGEIGGAGCALSHAVGGA